MSGPHNRCGDHFRRKVTAGFFSRFAKESVGNSIEIPVEVLAFHAEGHNGDVAYGVTMYSEVTGRMSATGENGGTLTMWGKMLISIRPDDPGAFGGHSYIELVSPTTFNSRVRSLAFLQSTPVSTSNREEAPSTLVTCRGNATSQRSSSGAASFFRLTSIAFFRRERGSSVSRWSTEMVYRSTRDHRPTRPT